MARATSIQGCRRGSRVHHGGERTGERGLTPALQRTRVRSPLNAKLAALMGEAADALNNGVCNTDAGGLLDQLTAGVSGIIYDNIHTADPRPQPDGTASRRRTVRLRAIGRQGRSQGREW